MNNGEIFPNFVQSHKATHENSISWWFGQSISSGFMVDEEIDGVMDVVVLNVIVTGFGDVLLLG